MDIWYLLQERAVPVTILALLMMGSAVVVFTVWKRRLALSMPLRLFTTIVCLVCIVVSAGLLLFTLFLGYNS
ncbi:MULTISPECIES: hypothetical protein [Exiguobacterium]|jgi:hypothetical protein|uniref:DUF2768 domain-containing protein n=1 Tax=Exiguobacterium undae TaxID=169177 RepID=A0ABX2VB95_9BACL|nr:MULTISPECIES: hypothetical protein [Exiguobacterium]OAN15426.1 hypothetical protein A3783_05685 [Exiguobacterium undae]